MAKPLADALGGRVTIYGDELSDVKLTGPTPHRGGSPTAIVAVQAYKFAGQCARLPAPIWVPVYAAGTAVTEGECGFHVGDVEKWYINTGEIGLALAPSSGSIVDLLELASVLGLSGGLDIENVRVESNRICADVKVWAKVSVAGQSKKFEETVTVCVGLGGGCASKEITSWADLEVCYNLPSEVCATLKVDIWGFSDSWTKCTGVYISDPCAPKPVCHTTNPQPTSPCSCNG